MQVRTKPLKRFTTRLRNSKYMYVETVSLSELLFPTAMFIVYRIDF